DHEDRTVLINSHVLSEIAQTADHLVVIGKGRLVADQTVHEVMKSCSETTTVVRSEHVPEMENALSAETVNFELTKDVESRDILVVPEHDTYWVGVLAYTYGLSLNELSQKSASLEEAFMQQTGHSDEYQAKTAGVGEPGMPATPSTAEPGAPAAGAENRIEKGE